MCPLPEPPAMPKRTREPGAGRALVPGRSSWPGCPTGDMALFNVRVMNVVRESDGARVSTRVEVSEITDILVEGGRIRTVQDTGQWSGGAPPESAAAFDGGGRVVMAGLGESSGAGSRTGD